MQSNDNQNKGHCPTLLNLSNIIAEHYYCCCLIRHKVVENFERWEVIRSLLFIRVEA